MGNVLAKAAGVVLRTVDRIKKAINYAKHKAAEAVRQFCKPIKEKLIDLAGKALIGTIRFHVNHPRLFKIIWRATAISLVCLTVSPVILSAVLPMFGFTSGGIAAGSLAAAWQASIGNVIACSLFAVLQSAAAGGYGVATVVGAFVAAGGLGSIVCSLLDSDSGSGFGSDAAGAVRRTLGGSGGGSIGPGPAPAPSGSTSESSPDGHAKQT